MARKKDKKVDAAAETTESDNKQQKQDKKETTADNDEEDDYEEDELELLQVDLGDMVKLKQILDEGVAGTLLEQLDEDYRLDNFKLGIMIGACLFAVVAQFAPIPFPESRPVLGICCCIYFVLSGILQLITTFIDQDSILLTKPLDVTTTTKDPIKVGLALKTNPDMAKYGIRVRSQFPRFSEWYTVILEFQKQKEDEKDNSKSSSAMVEQKWSVGQFFDKEGMFDEIGLQKEVEQLYLRFAQQKYDTPTDEAEKKHQ